MGDLRCYRCQQIILFDQNIISKSGKRIPLDSPGIPHNCKDSQKLSLEERVLKLEKIVEGLR